MKLVIKINWMYLKQAGMIFSIATTGLIIDNFIAIDRYDDTIPDVKYCFFSSAHPRHCQMLTSKWQKNGIYCSPITAKVLSVISNQRKCQISVKWIQPLDLNVWHEMDGFRVMLIDANHAPGAVMFIIEGERGSTLGRILYTGFFRADARFYQNLMGLSALQEKKFDAICIDSTYIDFTCKEFPTRRSSAKEASNLLRILRYNGIDNVAIPVPIIGYESFLVNISRELKCKIWLHPERYKIACILGIADYFSDTNDNTFIWTCSQNESQQVIFTTNSHIIKASMAPYVTPNILMNNEREHMIQYSDHCSLAELRLFLSLLSFCRIIGIPNKLSHLVEDKLQNLSLPRKETVNYCKEKHRNPEKLLFDPFKFSWRIGLAFDYAFRNFCDQLSAMENSLPDENMGKMSSEASHVDNVISEQPDSSMLVDVPDVWYSNAKIYSFKDFLANFISGTLNDDDGGEDNDAEDKLNKTAVFDVEYMECDSQRVKNLSQNIFESTESSLSDKTVVNGILEKQCDVSLLLDYLISRFDIKDTDYGSAEDAGFLLYMDISQTFNDFGDLLEKYQEKCVKAFSVGTMNQSYHVEKSIFYDSSNTLVPDVVQELLYCNPF